MIWRTMAVATAGNVLEQRSEDALHARALRVIALVVDLFLLVLISFVINVAIGATQIVPGAAPNVDSGSFQTSTGTAIDWPWQVLLAVAYYAIPEGLFGATPGKSLLGLCVVRVDGRPLRARDVVVRNVVRLIDWLPFMYICGGALAVFSANSQRLGDFAAGTTVVLRIDAPEPGATRDVGRRGRRLAAIAMVAVALGLSAFNYFGRPAQLIDAMYNGRGMPIRNSGYTLGQPHWSWGHVTYPVSGIQGGTTSTECFGTVTFDWRWFTWTESDSYFACGV